MHHHRLVTCCPAVCIGIAILLLLGSPHRCLAQTPAANALPANVATQDKGQDGVTRSTGDAPSADTRTHRFVRLTRCSDDSLKALETSITTFESTGESPVRVDLVGAIHVGERAYYEDLNRRFRQYDAVLYELVAAEGTRIPKGGAKSESSVSYLQSGMTQALGLAFQLDSIDYTRRNFVHADMTPSEFSESMKNRGETVSKMFFRMLGQSIAKQGASSGQNADLRMLQALLAENRELELRRAMAEQFSDLDGAMLVFSGPDGSTLITERNKKTLSVLQKEIAKGKRKIAIFFGAGHMDDMSARLMSDFGMNHAGCLWLTAWDLKSTAATNSESTSK